jgi:hypothetical protein
MYRLSSSDTAPVRGPSLLDTQVYSYQLFLYLKKFTFQPLPALYGDPRCWILRYSLSVVFIVKKCTFFQPLPSGGGGLDGYVPLLVSLQSHRPSHHPLLSQVQLEPSLNALPLVFSRRK